MTRAFFAGIAIYFSLHVVARSLFSNALELDEAAQVVMTQWWLPGYFSDPPLYTWIQSVFFWAFGLNVPALSLFKNLLLFLNCTFVFLSARRLLRDARLAVLPAVSLLFIPSIGWSSQRDLTHSVIAVTASAVTFFLVLRLLETPSVRDYLLLGLAMGLGIMTKYNYLIFAVALIITLLTFPNGRRMLSNRWLILTAFVAALVASPHLLWVLSHKTLAAHAAYKLQVAERSDILKGLGRLAVATLEFLGLPCAVYLIVLPGCFQPTTARGRWSRFPMGRLFLVLILLLILMVVVFGVTYFKPRWFQPLYFLVPLYLVSRLDSHTVSPMRVRWMIRLSILTGVGFVLGIFLRTLLPAITGRVTDYSFPNAAIAAEVRRQGFQRGLILADTQVWAGNLRLQFPDSLAVAPEYLNLVPQAVHRDQDIFIVWNAAKSAAMPASLTRVATAELGINTEQLTVVHTQPPYRFSTYQRASVGFCVVGKTRE